MTSTSGKRVCVIGAGIAGLVTAKVFKEDGFSVSVFEKEPELGGVWASSRTYPGLHANNPRETYAFSDFPYPETADDFPSAEQIRVYLDSYADHFGLRPLVRLSTEVLSVAPAEERDGHRKFKITLRGIGSEIPETLLFDFVVISNGVFSQPFLPPIEDRERFKGAVLHSSELTDPGMVSGKRVVVVGAGKSAFDCAAWAAGAARSCALVFRAPHWMVPRYFFGRIRLDRVIMTRVGELFLRYHRLNRFESFLHGPAGFLVRAWWRGYSRLLRRLLKMPAVLVPEAPLPRGFENIGTGSALYEALQGGRLALKRAGIRRFTDDAIELDIGETVGADVIVFATGWKQGFPFLTPDLLDQVWKNGELHLFRHILPPRQPGLGFIGYASSTACQLTSEIAAHWLSQWFRGELVLGSIEEMEREIARVLRWAGEMFPGRGGGYYIGPFVAHYIDDLMRDMGLPTRRRSGFLAEWFAPFWPDRYRTVGEERRKSSLPRAGSSSR